MRNIARSLLILALAVFPAALLTAPLYSEDIVIEAEDFINVKNIDNDEIETVPGSSCSGEGVLVGLSQGGEWTDYEITVNDPGQYEIHVQCRGDTFTEYFMNLVFSSKNGDFKQAVELIFDGAGFG